MAPKGKQLGQKRTQAPSILMFEDAMTEEMLVEKLDKLDKKEDFVEILRNVFSMYEKKAKEVKKLEVDVERKNKWIDKL